MLKTMTSGSAAYDALTATEKAEWSDSLKPVVLSLSIAMLVMGNLGVVLRIWAQWRIQKRPLAEDYWLVLAVVFANVVSVAVIVAVHYGLGYHLFRVKAMDPSGHALVKIFLCVWLTATFNGPSMLATKIALLLWYRRLFIVQQLWLRIFWWINMVYIVLWAIGSTVSYMFSCVPIQYYWERIDHTSTVHGICRNTTTADGLPLILDLISDAAIMALPIATIATLQMPLARKVALMIVFSVGLISVISAVARVVVLYLATNLHTDFTYAAAPFELLDVIQLNMAIVCATAVPIISRVRLAFREARTKNQSSAGLGSYGHTSSPSSRWGRIRLEESSSSTELVQVGHSSASCSSKLESQGPMQMKGIMVQMDVDIRR